MSEYRKTTQDDLFFITLTVTGWVDLFTRRVYKDILVKNLTYCQEKEGFQIFCYFIISNHIHMICRRLDSDLSELLGGFKSYTSKQLLNEIETNTSESRKNWLLNQFNYQAKLSKQYSTYHLWQSFNHTTILDQLEIIKQKYIHKNSVRAGMVTEASSYLYRVRVRKVRLKYLRFSMVMPDAI
jgi:putative transposase